MTETTPYFPLQLSHKLLAGIPTYDEEQKTVMFGADFHQATFITILADEKV